MNCINMSLNTTISPCFIITLFTITSEIYWWDSWWLLILNTQVSKHEQTSYVAADKFFNLTNNCMVNNHKRLFHWWTLYVSPAVFQGWLIITLLTVTFYSIMKRIYLLLYTNHSPYYIITMSTITKKMLTTIW